MPHPQQEQFLKAAEEKAFSRKHRDTLNFNIDRYDTKVAQGQQQFADLERARKLAKNIKWWSLERLPQLLEQFEKQFTARGGKVIWAENAAQAREAVEKIVAEKAAQKVVKSKSMVTEEIGLNAALEKAGVEVLETDLGEYIVQLKEETPYHIVTPAMHLSKEEVAELFHEKFGTATDASPEYLSNYVRELLRERYRQADIGITGGNFLLAESGAVVLVENEGNGRLSTALPKTHIAIVGLEKVLPSMQHLQLFLPLLSTFGTGQQLTVYNSILHGPRQAGESDGPENMYVILLDNGRSRILADTNQRQSLYCIRCGACLNACPIYKNIGGHSYETTYQGPIGSVITPHLRGMQEFGHLSNASSLCGKCTEVCPVKIDLHQLLLQNRQTEREQGLKPKSERFIWKQWERLMLNRWMMNAPSFTKNWFLKAFMRNQWGDRRKLPRFSKKSFNKMWRQGEVGKS